MAFHYYGPLHYCVLAYSASLPGKLKAALSSEMRALHLANWQSESKSQFSLLKTIVCFLLLISPAVLLFLHKHEVNTFHFVIG